MGSDIHIKCEVRRKGKWRTAFPGRRSEYAEPGEDDIDDDHHVYGSRNYDLFAILANVRNGRGFAGLVTGEGFNVIAEPRGLPSDMDAETAKWSERSIDHTPTWLTLSEILAFDWTQTTKKRGILSWIEFEKWNRWGRKNGLSPDSYCGGISGPDLCIVPEEEMERILASLLASSANWRTFYEAARAEYGDDDLGGTYRPIKLYAECTWTIEYARACEEFWVHAIPHLLRLGDPKDVRLVFGFDS